MNIITTTDDLIKLCVQLHKADYLTVDTEFLRESTYYSKLCLIQVADSESSYIIDPLLNEIDLSPFYDVMANDKVLKVFHACRQDLEIFYHEMNTVPSPIFDTQVAAMVCGYGDSIGYETLVNRITKHKLDKTARYTDWSRRPLSGRQLEYAIGDVTHLREIYDELAKQLDENNRTSWIDEEMEILTAEKTYDIDPEDMWQKIKIRTNKKRTLGILKELAAWRERRAQKKDMPRRRVLKDEVLLEIAAHPPKDRSSLDKTRGLSKGFSQSHAGKEFMIALEKGLKIPDEDLPETKNTKAKPPTPPMADLLKVLLKIKCQETGVAPRLISNMADLEFFAARPTDDAKIMHGWRYEVFGHYAKSLIEGKLALSADEDGNISVVKVGEPQSMPNDCDPGEFEGE